MKHKQDNIADRLKTARDAKAAMLKRIAERPVADEATVRQKQAERQAILAARAVRQAEAEEKRQAALEAEAKQREADAILRQAQQEQAVLDAAQAVQRAEDLKIEQKVARDARYAARKARK